MGMTRLGLSMQYAHYVLHSKLFIHVYLLVVLVLLYSTLVYDTVHIHISSHCVLYMCMYVQCMLQTVKWRKYSDQV